MDAFSRLAMLFPCSAARAAGLAVVLLGAALLALPWLRPAPEQQAPAPVAAPLGVTVSTDGERTVASAVPEPAEPPPLPGRPAARVAIEAAEAEPNDNLAVANAALLGTAIEGALGEGDLDYFAVEAPAARWSEIVATLVLSAGDASLTIFDDAGVALGQAVTRTALGVHAVTLGRKADRPRYHVLVMATAPGTGAYRLTIAERRL